VLFTAIEQPVSETLRYIQLYRFYLPFVLLLQYYPPTVNDPKLAALASHVAVEALGGEEYVAEAVPSMAGEWIQMGVGVGVGMGVGVGAGAGAGVGVGVGVNRCGCGCGVIRCWCGCK